MSEINSVPASSVEIVLSVPYVTASGQKITHVTMRAPTDFAIGCCIAGVPSRKQRLTWI